MAKVVLLDKHDNSRQDITTDISWDEAVDVAATFNGNITNNYPYVYEAVEDDCSKD